MHRGDNALANDLVQRPIPPDAASELAAFSDPSALGDHLDFVVFLKAARHAREAQGLTLTEVAERMGVDHAAVSRLESGKPPKPTVNTLMRYVEAIGLRIAWGLTERDDKPIPRGEGRQRRRIQAPKTGSKPTA